MGGFERDGGVLGHAPTVKNKGRGHKRTFPGVAICGGEEAGGVPLAQALEMEQMGEGRMDFRRRKTSVRVGSRTVIQNINPSARWKLLGITSLPLSRLMGVDS